MTSPPYRRGSDAHEVIEVGIQPVYLTLLPPRVGTIGRFSLSGVDLLRPAWLPLLS